MKKYCQLRIESSNENYPKISKILGVRPISYDIGWVYEIELNELSYIDAINDFLHILNDRYDELKKIHISTNDISFWILIENDGQSNIEFEPKFMKNIGGKGISLCISVW